MIDIKIIRNDLDLVKKNMEDKFQHDKLPIADKVYELDRQFRAAKTEADELRAKRNSISKQIGGHMAKGQKEEANQLKAEVAEIDERQNILESEERRLSKEVSDLMMKIPNIIGPEVPIGKDDSENVELKCIGEPATPKYEVPYHVDILEGVGGLDLDSARRTSGSGFYYLRGDIARLHSALLAYARDFMISKGFEYFIPPYMIRSAVVDGVMSFEERDNMMYKIEGEDLYLIGTSEHSMIGKFMETIIPESDLPILATSSSPCFRKEVGAHGLEERGIYRVHQFEKQEMITICKPEDSAKWFEKLYGFTSELFSTLDIPVRLLECCSGDLADLKVRSLDVEAWSPRQQKYFEIASCSNLGEAQSRRLGIRVRGEKGLYFPHTLNNTVIAPPRMLISFIENNYLEGGSIALPEAIRPYMGGKDKILVKTDKNI